MAPSNNRRYSEDEIQAIFRRATERQEATGTADPHHGLTLDELKTIGAESGIDPAHVEAAVADIERGEVGTASLSLLERFHGLPATVRVERIVPGTVNDATWNDGVEVLRSTFNTRGQDGTIGPVREWRAFTSSGFDYQALMQDETWYTLMEGLNLTQNKTRSPVHVEARPEGDNTRIIATYEMPDARLWEAPGIAGSVWFVGLVMGLVYLFGSLPATFLFVPLGFLLLGGLFGAWQRHVHRTEIQTTRRRIEKALDRIEYLQAATAPSAARAGEASSLDWDAEDESAASPLASQRQRDRS